MIKNISLTDFVDFSIRNGPSRLTKIKEIKGRDDYHPSLDYWKGVRDGLEEFHKHNKEKIFLDSIIENAHPNKKENYKIVIDKYKTFLGRKNMEWFNPPRNDWTFNEVSIRVNPELGLMINGTPHIIKIYFKENSSQPQTKLDKRKLETIFYLMENSLQDKIESECMYSVLNAKTGKLITKNREVLSIKEILESDALAFNHIWEST